MVVAYSHLKLLPTSILNIYRVFEHINILFIGIWWQPYAVMAQDLGRLGHHGGRDDLILSAKLIIIAPETSSFQQWLLWREFRFFREILRDSNCLRLSQIIPYRLPRYIVLKITKNTKSRHSNNTETHLKLRSLNHIVPIEISDVTCFRSEMSIIMYSFLANWNWYKYIALQ